MIKTDIPPKACWTIASRLASFKHLPGKGPAIGSQRVRALVQMVDRAPLCQPWMHLGPTPALRDGAATVALMLIVVASTNFVAKNDIFAALPLRRWSWHCRLILVRPPVVVVVILAVWNLELRLPQLSFLPSQICGPWRRIAASIVVDACYTTLALWR